MNFALPEIAECRVDQAMPGKGAESGKGGRDDAQFIMSARGGAGVTGMAMRLVFDVQRQRLKSGQALAHQCDGLRVQAGRTLRKGLTLTCAYTPAAT